MDQVSESSDFSAESRVGKFLAYRLSRVQAKLNAQGSRILQNAAGLSLIQWRIITLVEANDGATSSELTTHSEIDKGLFSRKLKTLIESGIIRARVDQSDNRVHHLHLTEKGRTVFDRVLPVMERRQDLLHQGLGTEDAEVLFELLMKVEDLLDSWENS